MRHEFLQQKKKKEFLQQKGISISVQDCIQPSLSLNCAEVRERQRAAMPEETTSIDYVMEAASGPHFSGLRLDGLLSSPPASSSSSPADRSMGSAAASAFSPLATDSNAPKQPFVIGN